MKEKESNKEKTGLIQGLVQNKKIRYVLVALMFIVIIFVLFYSFEDANPKNDDGDSVMEYVSQLERKLEKNLSTVSGAGKVSVMISVESGMETVLATKITVNETENGVEKTETPLVVNGKTVTVKELYPKIKGIVIISEGANSLTVKRNLQQATLSLLDVKVNQIEILTMK